MTLAVEQDRMPHSIEAERAVLGSLLLDRQAIVAVSEILGDKDFYRGAHGLIYRAVLALYRAGKPADFVTVIEFIEAKSPSGRHLLDEVGGAGYLAQLVESTPTAVHANHHAGIVAEHAFRRRLIDAGTAIVGAGYDTTREIDGLVADAAAAVQTAAASLPGQDWQTSRSLVDGAWARLGERVQERLPFGIADLDAKVGGMRPEQLVVPAARPGHGKSALVIQAALATALSGKRAAIMSLEMSAEEITDRLVAHLSRVNMFGFLRRDVRADDDWTAISAALGRLHDLPLLIDDKVKPTIEDVSTRARRMHAAEGLDLLVVDYLQLLGSAGKVDNRVQELSRVTRGLKALARELKIPVLAPSQLNREVESRSDGVPRLRDLRESGSIEMDADMVVFIHWPWESDPSLPLNVVELKVAKHRNGPMGAAQALWRPEIARFDPLARGTN